MDEAHVSPAHEVRGRSQGDPTWDRKPVAVVFGQGTEFVTLLPDILDML